MGVFAIGSVAKYRHWPYLYFTDCILKRHHVRTYALMSISPPVMLSQLAHGGEGLSQEAS